MENKNVYIMSIDASEIYNHTVRGKRLEETYSGMIPDSLQLRKLRTLNYYVEDKVRESGKSTSRDVINVKFKYDVGDADSVLDAIKIKLDKVNSQLDTLEQEINEENDTVEKKLLEAKYDKKQSYAQSLADFIETIISEKDKDEFSGKWEGVGKDDLRKKLYSEGFSIKYIDKRTGEIETINYSVFQRSSSKSRTGQCLFLKTSLCDEMRDWSRMQLHSKGLLKDDQDIDLASLLSYEALTGSSITDVVKIRPKNILLIEDIDSVFKHDANIVEFNNEGKLSSRVEENAEIVNSIWDGQSLLDKNYFPEDKSMMLLRNHFFKSASFACSIQDFLKDNKPKGVRYREWKLKDMFGNEIKAQDVHLITTPNSLKALKLSHVFGGGDQAARQMYSYWKDLVKEQGSLFGVVKSEKASQKGVNDENMIVNQFTYQILNSLPMTKEEVSDLTQFEQEYIMKLKNDDEVYKEYLRQEANDQNAHSMFADIMEINPDIVNTKMFRHYRAKQINKYVKHARKSKFRIVSDYAVMCSNPLSMLKKAIGQFDINTDDSDELQGNQIHTTLFPEGDVAGFRNPHSSPSNAVLFINKHNGEINKYMKVTNNIVFVNSINFPLQDLLSSCDFDSDTTLLSIAPSVLSAVKKVWGKYLPCLNYVKSRKNPYKLNNISMYEVDKALAMSTEYIGKTVNTGQLALSAYYDNDLDPKMLDQVNIVTVLSTICIDLAKKFYDGLDIDKEIKNIESSLPFSKRKKPLFWKYIRKTKKKSNNGKRERSSSINYIKFDCPMDYLQEVLDELPQANSRENIDLFNLLRFSKLSRTNKGQVLKIRTAVNDLNDYIHEVNQKGADEEEKDRMIETKYKYTKFRLEKLKVNERTIQSAIHQSLKRGENSITLLKTLHSSFPDEFTNAFIKKTS